MGQFGSKVGPMQTVKNPKFSENQLSAASASPPGPPIPPTYQDGRRPPLDPIDAVQVQVQAAG